MGFRTRRALHEWFAALLSPLTAHARKWHGGTNARLTPGYCAMQKNVSLMGPRGWALLVLCGGVALASPFLRLPAVDPSQQQPAPPELGEAAWLTASFAHEPVDVPPYPGRGLPPVNHQQLPSTYANQAPVTLPAWAPPHSQLDDLIAQGAAPAWDAEKTQTELAPLEPWRNATPPSSRQTSSAPRATSGQPVPQEEFFPSPSPLSFRTSPWEMPRETQQGSGIAGIPSAAMPEPLYGNSANEGWAEFPPQPPSASFDSLAHASSSRDIGDTSPPSGPVSHRGLVAGTSGKSAASSLTATAIQGRTQVVSPVGVTTGGAAATPEAISEPTSQPAQRQFVYQPGWSGPANANAVK